MGIEKESLRITVSPSIDALPVYSCQLLYPDTRALCEAVNAVIAQGIKNRGTTFRDYKDGEGKSGENQKYLLVYGRGGKPCKKCGEALATAKVGGRGTVYCQHCQK